MRGEIPQSVSSDIPQEKCGITAIFSKTGEPISYYIPLIQEKLHHRGRDDSGMEVFDREEGVLRGYKGKGSTREVFGMTKVDDGFKTNFDFAAHKLISDVAIGHNRYGTSGNEHKDSGEGAQPMEAEWQGRSIAVAFNGNIPEQERMKLQARIPEDMERGHFDTVDIAQAIVSADGNDWKERIKNGMEGVKGAYSLTILTDTGEVFGLRGPSGTWPLWVGESERSVVFASETVVKPSLSWSEVKPGELVKATRDGVERTQLFESPKTTACSLHDVYGAKGESLRNRRETYRTFRERVGQKMAEEHPIEADIYGGVPNSGLDLAKGYTDGLGVPLTNIFRVLDSAERSYIAKDKHAAFSVIKGKFTINEELLENNGLQGKRVVIVEDSAIKGATLGGDSNNPETKGIIGYLRDAGASEVHVVLALPKFVNECDQGYVIQKDLLVGLKQDELGNYEERETAEIAEVLGADSISYISHEGLEDVYGPEYSPCFSCMGGAHPFYGRQEGVVINIESRKGIIDNADELVTMNVAD